MTTFLCPSVCEVCHRMLVEGEEVLCLHCRQELQPAMIHQPGQKPYNAAVNEMVGRFDFEHGAAYASYGHDSVIQHMLVEAKYHDRPYLNGWLGRQLALSLLPEGWPHDVDVIVPIPVHWLRRLMRGYNQTRPIAEALGKVWHLPVEERCLYRRRYIASQVGYGTQERLERMRGIMAVRHAERLAGRHVLLVDDIMTSGSTLCDAADALRAAVPDVRLSFVTLAVRQ